MKKALLLGGGLILALLVWRWTVATSATAITTVAASSAPGVQVPQTSGAAVTNLPGLGPVPTDPKEIEKFKAKAKREMQTALQKVGLFTDRADMIREEDSGELVWKKSGDSKYVMFSVQGYMLEPFAPRTLDALGHVLKHSENAAERLSAATLLYRYGRESGRLALLELLKQGENEEFAMSAAITLARNKDPGAFAGTLALLNRVKEINPSFMHALGNWDDPAVAQGLAQKLELNPKDDFVATALAYQDSVLALPTIKNALVRRKGGLDFISIRLEAMATRLGGFAVEDFQQHFQSMLQKQPQLGSQLMAVLEQAGPRVGGPELLKILENFVPQHQRWVTEAEQQAQKVLAKDPTAYHSYPKPIPFGALSGAAQFAADWELKAAVPLLERLIPQLQKGTKVFNDLNQQLGVALYRLDPVGWRHTLVNAGIRLEHIERIPEIAALRPVAHDQVPQQKNLVWR